MSDKHVTTENLVDVAMFDDFCSTDTVARAIGVLTPKYRKRCLVASCS